MIDAAAHAQAEANELSTIVLDQADRLFREQATRERLAEAERTQWPSAIWQAVEQAGLTLALVREVQGGVGLPPADALRLIRRGGYHTLPVPLAETMLGAALWAEASGESIPGSMSLAPARPSDAIRIDGRGAGFALHGEAGRVPWGAQVEHVLVHARTDAGLGYLALLPGKRGHALPRRNLANEPRDTLRLDGIVLAEEAVRLAPPMCVEGFLVLGALMRAQQMVGAIERCLDYALAYAMERQQFGRPIAKFQAIQHLLAEAAGQYAAAAAAADLAIDAYGTGDLAFAVAVAKARAGEAAGKVAEIAHQVHGAMGFTQEHPLHFATRRLWSWRDEFGSEAFWQERIGRLACGAGGEALWPMLVGS